jgi:hypothetical protein
MMFMPTRDFLFRITAACVVFFCHAAIAQTNIAFNKPTTASSAIQPTSSAVDGNGSTRWESIQGLNTGWLQVDLGAAYSLTSTAIDWEAANAATYDVQGSIDNSNWTTIISRSGGTFGNRTDNLTLNGNYRYLRINATSRSVGNYWGYSIWEWRVFGSAVISSSSKSSSKSSSSISSLSSSSSTSVSIVNLALGGITSASTALGASANAVDGNMSTRWESTHGIDPSWIRVDLKAEKSLTSVVIFWEAANAANYEIQGSNDNSSWTTLAARTGGAFGNRTDTVAVSGSYRYVRIYGTTRSVGNYWGYSIFELQVFGPGNVSSLSSSSSSSSSDRNNYNAPRATTAPVIDGVIDAVWNSAPWAPIDVFWLGSQHPTPQDFSGRYKAMWDQGNLYLLFDITDDVLFDATANPLERYWDDDSVEIFIDENKNGGNHQFNTSAWAYHVSTLGDVVDFTNSSTVKLLNDHITMRKVSNGTRHIWEMSMRVYGENYDDNKVNVPLVLTLNKLMGFSVCYNDNDASANRESMIGSVDTQGHKDDQGYINASVFGSMRLVEAPAAP